MSNFTKNCRLRIGSLFGKFIVEKTADQPVRDLIKSLHPISYEKELIRVGGSTDGGYLIPDDLDGIAGCFSPGVADSSSLEYDCAERGMEVFMADYSVDEPAAYHERFHFIKKFVGVTENDQFMTLDRWVAENDPDPDSDLLLQMDIEGFEYEVLLAASDRLMERFRIIVVEFHRLDYLWDKPFFRLASRAFEKLLQTHYCLHAHPNNWRGTVKKGTIEIPINMEFTFVRKDRVGDFDFAREFPHPLDVDNVPAKPTLPLPPCWYHAD